MNWENDREIAKALEALYPDASVNSMPESELIEKVTALPGFTGEKQPLDKKYIIAIVFQWGLVRSARFAKKKTEDTFYYPDSAYV